MAGEDEEHTQWIRREVLPLEPSLRAYAARFCHGGGSEVDDLVHDTFAKLFSYADWRSIDNVGGFASRILKNLALQAARRRKVVAIHVIADLGSLGVADDLPGADRVIGARDDLRVLAKLIGELPPQCRRVFTLRKVYGLSTSEIAVRLGLSISTVEKHVIKGLRYCSERLAEAPRREQGLTVSRAKARRWSGSE